MIVGPGAKSSRRIRIPSRTPTEKKNMMLQR